MKKQGIFTGLILLGIGLLFFLDQTAIVGLRQLNDWTLLLLILGVAMLSEAYWGKNNEMILPGVILFGLGIHFNVMKNYSFWPNNLEVILLILGAAFLLRHQKTRDGLWVGLLFFLVAVLLLFFDWIVKTIPASAKSLALVWQFWPLFFIVLGSYVLFIKKR